MGNWVWLKRGPWPSMVTGMSSLPCGYNLVDNWGRKASTFGLCYCGHLGQEAIFIKINVIYVGWAGVFLPCPGFHVLLQLAPYPLCSTPQPGNELQVVSFMNHCWESTFSGQQLSLPGFFIMFWIIYFTKCGGNIVCRMRQRNRCCELSLHPWEWPG